jgi:hypothetical protein
MAKDKLAIKTKTDAFYTRAKSLRLMNAGADLTATFVNDKGMTLGRYLDHPNYHVRQHAFHLMGRSFPEDVVECAKLCKALHIKDPNVVDEVNEVTTEKEEDKS